MSQKKTNTNNKDKKKKFIPSRKTVLYLLWFVVLPILVISISVFTTYKVNKVTPFAEEQTDTDFKVMKGSKFTDFTFNFYCSDYRNSSSTAAQFKAAAYDDTILGNVSSVTYGVVLGSDWIGYLTNESSIKTITFGTADSHSFTSVSISGFDKQYPVYGYPFVIISSPTAYVYLSYTVAYINEITVKNYILTYSYDEYFTSSTLGGQ